MKITEEYIQEITEEPPQNVRLLEISNAELLFIENIQKSGSLLQSVTLRGNYLKEVENIYTLKNLWTLDLAHNELTSLTGLSRFVALGTLNLAFNNLGWKALYDIKHIHICNLHLMGNLDLERDANYRKHVVDSLPNSWVLDGKFISAIERVEVTNFFRQSEMTPHPVRHKLPKKERFQPTYKKNLLEYGVFGAKAEELFMNFPTRDTSLVINSEMDRKKLYYLAHNLQDDLELERESVLDMLECEVAEKFMEDLLSVRSVELERSNMLLLLIVASLEYPLPYYVMRELLETAQLDFMGGVNTLAIFDYPRRVRVEIAVILAGAVKVDKDERKNGGMYPSLYLSMKHTLANLVKAANSDRVHYVKRKWKRSQEYLRLKPILAAEVVQLLCVTPSFYDIAHTDAGIQELLSVACGDEVSVGQVTSLVERFQSPLSELSEEEKRCSMEDIAKLVITSVQNNTSDILSGKKTFLATSGHSGFRRAPYVPPYQNLVYRPRSGYERTDDVTSLEWLHEQLSPRRRSMQTSAVSARGSTGANIRPYSARGDVIKGGVIGSGIRSAGGGVRSRPVSSVGGTSGHHQAPSSSRTQRSRFSRPSSGKSEYIPRIGDLVLLGPQNTGQIKSIPDRNIALVMIGESTAQNGGVVTRMSDEDKYVYVGLDEIEYDTLFDWWKPKNYVGDRVTLVNPSRFNKRRIDAEQLAFETKIRFAGGNQENSVFPGSFHSSMLNLLASKSSDGHIGSPSETTTPSPAKTPVEWENNPNGFPPAQRQKSKDLDDVDGDNDSTKGMSRASSPVDAETLDDRQEEDFNSSVISLAKELTEKCLQDAFLELDLERSKDRLDLELHIPLEPIEPEVEMEKEEVVKSEENETKKSPSAAEDGQKMTQEVEPSYDFAKDFSELESFVGKSEGQSTARSFDKATRCHDNGRQVHAVKEDEIPFDVYVEKYKQEREAELEQTAAPPTYREVKFPEKDAKWFKGFDHESRHNTSLSLMEVDDLQQSGFPVVINNGLTARRLKSAPAHQPMLGHRAKKPANFLKSGNAWLAGGKDVYQPVEMTENYLIPGWVQSMEPRAKKAYLRKMINRYTENIDRRESSMFQSRVSVRAMSAQMKYVCNNCTGSSRQHIMQRYYSPHVVPRVSDPETYWR